MNEEVENVPTYGEKLVGLQFNPSNDSDVQKAKVLCAQLADMLENNFNKVANDTGVTTLYYDLHKHAIGELLNAQMNIVKVLTLKY